MSKTGQTKNRILEIIKSTDKATLTYISEKLDLHPSTVGQHLQELKNIEAIQEVDNKYIKKWKYYKLNPEFDYQGLSPEQENGNVSSVSRKWVFGIIALALIGAIVGGYLILVRSNISTRSSGDIVQIALTDPPVVPNNTQALYINYSSVSLHAYNSNVSEWFISNVTGDVNLINLTNFSQVIAGIGVPQNYTVDTIKIDINAAYIIINGSKYNVTLRGGQIVTNVSNSSRINPNSEVLVDFAPTVTPLYINGMTVFFMLPESASVVINRNATNDSISGERSRLDADELKDLGILGSNLNLTRPSLNLSNNSVNFSVTVRNNGNKTVVLRDVLILGPQNLTNSTGMYQPVPLVPVSRKHFGIDLIVQDNGTLAFAQSRQLSASLERISYVYPLSLSGATLNPGQSIVFTYSGRLNISNSTGITLFNDTSYKISVLGDYVSHLSVNVTST